MCCWSCGFVPPLLLLDHIKHTHPSHYYKQTNKTQKVYAFVMTAVYFAVVTLLEGRPSEIGATVAAKFWPTLAANWLVWPLAHLVNFRFVPAPYRIL